MFSTLPSIVSFPLKRAGARHRGREEAFGAVAPLGAIRGLGS